MASDFLGRGAAVRVAFAAAFSAAAFCGCRTNKEILNDYEAALVAGDYAKPLSEIEEKAEGGGVDELMWRLHAGGTRYLTGERDAAAMQFDKAEDIFIRNDGTSVFRQGADGTLAMMTNDRAFPYSGGGEDRIFACLYKAVDYASGGKPDAARTELNRAAQHQDNWLWERKKEIADAAEKLSEDADAYAKKEAGENAESSAEVQSKSATAVNGAFADADFGAQIKENCAFDTATSGNVDALSRKDWLNRYVQHVTGVFRWAAGDGDGANYLKELTEIDPGNVLLKADFAGAAKGAKPEGSVWVFVEDGLGPVREEWRLDLPIGLIPYAGRYVIYAGMALPYLRYRNAACTAYSLSAGGKVRRMVELQDVDALLKTEFDVYFRGALTREITRTVVKVGAQVALGIAAENSENRSAYWALKGAQIGVAGYAAAVTQADLRSWTGLPKKVYAMRMPRPADGRIVLSGDGAPVAEINVPDGISLVFVRKPSAQAPAVVKVATFPN